MFTRGWLHKQLVGSLEHVFVFHSVGNVIIPTDFHIFKRGLSNHQSDMIHVGVSEIDYGIPEKKGP